MSKIGFLDFWDRYFYLVKETIESTVKTILCAIDFSESTRHSLEWAASMAKHMRAHLTILYTYRLTPQTGEVVMMKKIIEQEAHQKFIELEKDYLLNQGITYDFRIEIGFVSDRIEDHARKNDLSFLVMDKTIKGSSRESLDELANHIRVPMLLVP